MARNRIVPEILEILQAGAESTVDLLDIFTSGYSASYRKARRTMRHGPPQFKSDWAYEYRRKQEYYNLLNYLQRQGFIEKKKTSERKGSLWRITKKGLEKVHLLKKNKGKRFTHYEKQEDSKTKIVIFDIPERERHKRVWLRTALIALGFSLLQKSVWVGNVKIPEDFIRDLRDIAILRYIHIFEITKKGTIHPLS